MSEIWYQGMYKTYQGMHKPKDVPRTTQQWASIICSISKLTPHWLYSSRFIASHRSLLSSHTQRITISIRNYMCENLNRLPLIITKTASQPLASPTPPKNNFRPTRLRVQETRRNAERLPQRSLILQLVVGHRLLLYWLPRLYVQLWGLVGTSLNSVPGNTRPPLLYRPISSNW